MQPQQVLLGWQSVESAWSLMAQGQWQQIPPESIDVTVLRSWQRCSLRADPRGQPKRVALSPDAFPAVVARHRDLMLNAGPVLEDLVQFTEGTECVVVLTDSTGCILTVAGEERTRVALSQYGVREGVYWNETLMGTNAFGLALIEAMPVLVVGAEHLGYPATAKTCDGEE